MLEPIQSIFIQVPQAQLGSATKELSGRRGQILDITSEGDLYTIKGKAPVAEMFGFSGDIRSATEGRALWNYEVAGFEEIPSSLQKDVIRKIRDRKGLPPEVPSPSDFV
jgi:elongation factor 2